ncbi:Pyridoxal phosphate-dependent transferase, major domain protein [Metarhizium album ARSEF 1941]|uniref:Pyridoxal phosphate-dependent transferase, major domain protein n=1 Tax=Metarhizium album (strain ARSEF 1941) TaxID=1081103 RepID=A0A0B2WTS4_METAS|nr:Pyridoxal phosphate-dependent transferase, major domain protein [Metarhizium album ARSEF 1941]KHN97453.1 Pyridoxal phosphate-dependent transferase, major domain protein [Metarhizium album ARSEF 1941]
MNFRRTAIEIEAPEEVGQTIHHNLCDSAVGDRTLDDLGIRVPGDLPLSYSVHLGSPRFRSLIAERCGLEAEDILVTAGASSALFIVATSLLGEKDHLVITRPNYASNVETPRAIGCEITYVDLEFDKGFQVDVNDIASAIKPNTKLISLTTPNNPTGTSMSGEDLRRVAELAKTRGCYVLVDETYAELTYLDRLPGSASLGNHVIGVSSMSKAFGVPGIRVGWISSKSKNLLEVFLAAKEQISITVSVVDEYVAEQILERCDTILDPIIQEMKRRRDRVEAWVASEDLIQWVRPNGGVMGFMRMKKEPAGGTKAFYERLLAQHGTYVGPGHWFEWPDTYFRLGYGWPTAESLERGLVAISKAMRG